MLVTEDMAKLKSNKGPYFNGKLAFLAGCGSLGGVCVGYQTCIAAGALISMEKDFPNISLTVKEVRCFWF